MGKRASPRAGRVREVARPFRDAAQHIGETTAAHRRLSIDTARLALPIVVPLRPAQPSRGSAIVWARRDTAPEERT